MCIMPSAAVAAALRKTWSAGSSSDESWHSRPSSSAIGSTTTTRCIAAIAAADCRMMYARQNPPWLISETNAFPAYG